MNKRTFALLAALVGLSLAPLSAQDTKPATPTPPPTPTAEHVDKKGKGSREDWDKLTEAEKAEKLKERKAKMEARLKDLKAKKAAGTLTDKETQQLERLEKQAARGDRPPGDRPAGGKRPKKDDATAK
jgi:hypothetical protein